MSKTFGESLSRFYYDRYGIETVALRIGSCFPEPRDRRMLVTWLSYADLTERWKRCRRRIPPRPRSNSRAAPTSPWGLMSDGRHPVRS
ncbi:MAG TPA: hypothetical protein VNU21_12230 [Usitatibacter sp.]|nr:hypothetical protein [Usitatibacter sp.]